MDKKQTSGFFKHLSPISTYHYLKLVGRSALFLIIFVDFVYCYFHDITLFTFPSHIVVLLGWAVWLIYMVEMVLRLFPSRLESMGCQKQFRKNFVPVIDYETCHQEDNQWLLIERRKRGRKAVIVSWCILNGIIGIFYFTGIFDSGFMMVIAMAFSVCDMICILFFCPFQTWFMKNKCCSNCYIYNWDYMMMFTPLIFVPSFYTYTLVAMSWIVLLKWEIQLRRKPEWFDYRTNKTLACANCNEKLCKHKKQLQSFIKTLEKESILNNYPLIQDMIGQNNRFDRDDETENK